MSGGIPVPDEIIAIQLQAHRQNIARYRSLLRTELTEIERTFIDRRIAEATGLVPFDSAVNADDWATQS